MKIGIVGGGICGLTLALSLQKAGIPFHLFERAPEFHEAGAGILIYKNTYEILKRIGVGESFNRESSPIRTFSFVNRTIKHTIVQPPTDDLGYSIHRVKLIELLGKAVDKSNYSLNANIEDVSDQTDFATIKAHGVAHKFDMVIACDGVHSKIRAKFIPQLKPRYSGQVTWRGITTIKDHQGFENVGKELWGLNKRFGFIHLGGDRFFWYTAYWEKYNQDFKEDKIKEQLLNYFEGFHPFASQLISNGSSIFQTRIKDIPPNDAAWYSGRIVFAGDSIHASTPDLGQGACQAIESAYVLSLCINKNPSDLNQAFLKYQQLRQKKTKLVNYFSYRFTRFGHHRNEWKYTAFKTIIACIPYSYLLKRYKEMIDISYLKDLET